MNREKQGISCVSRRESPGSVDITVKKKIKYLTFDFHCVRKMWIMNDEIRS